MGIGNWELVVILKIGELVLETTELTGIPAGKQPIREQPLPKTTETAKDERPRLPRTARNSPSLKRIYKQEQFSRLNEEISSATYTRSQQYNDEGEQQFQKLKFQCRETEFEIEQLRNRLARNDGFSQIYQRVK
jgi:hypothetical protein